MYILCVVVVCVLMIHSFGSGKRNKWMVRSAHSFSSAEI